MVLMVKDICLAFGISVDLGFCEKWCIFINIAFNVHYKFIIH